MIHMINLILTVNKWFSVQTTMCISMSIIEAKRTTINMEERESIK